MSKPNPLFTPKQLAHWLKHQREVAQKPTCCCGHLDKSHDASGRCEECPCCGFLETMA